MLRDYQIWALEQLRAARRPTVLQMPTGSGKTITAVEFIREAVERGPVWFVCHRREIIRQTQRALNAVGIEPGIIVMGRPATPRNPVQVGSVGKLRRCHKSFPRPATVIWDECHHVAAPTWAALREAYPAALHIGLTATPERLDGKGLETWFDELIGGPSIASLIESGHLARYRFFAPTIPDLSTARLNRSGEYKQADLERRMNAPVVIGDAVEHYNRIAPDSRALVFAVSVSASKAIAARFNEQGTPAVHVDASTPDEERDAAIAALGAGRLRVLTSVGVFTEGVDVPQVDTIILLRPTKSVALYLQMIGRGLRPAPGKTQVTVLDHSGLVYEHGLPDAAWDWSLNGGAKERRAQRAREAKEIVRRCPACFCAHTVRATCPDCGFAYPSGRAVGEFDGQLFELKAERPDGYETQTDFARRLGISRSVLEDCRKNGLPSFTVPGGPSGHGRMIPIQRALQWLRDNPPLQIPPLFVDDPGQYAPRQKFSEIAEIRYFDDRWIKRGIPCATNRWIHVIDGLAWLESNVPRRKSPPRLPEYREYESKTAFARRVSDIAGVTVGGAALVLDWERRGLPCAPNGWVHIEDGIRWIRALRSNRMPPMDVPRPQEFESNSAFARRVGVSQTLVSSHWRKRGLPSASNGWVHIEDGLKWAAKHAKRAAVPERYRHRDAAETSKEAYAQSD